MDDQGLARLNALGFLWDAKCQDRKGDFKPVRILAAFFEVEPRQMLGLFVDHI